MIDHSKHQSDLPINLQILNISVNMARIANWTADSYSNKVDLIRRFMEQTESYLNDLSDQSLSKKFQPTLLRFKSEFETLKKERINEKNKLIWAEKALTWANILQHRAKLA